MTRNTIVIDQTTNSVEIRESIDRAVPAGNTNAIQRKGSDGQLKATDDFTFTEIVDDQGAVSSNAFLVKSRSESGVTDVKVSGEAVFTNDATVTLGKDTSDQEGGADQRVVYSKPNLELYGANIQIKTVGKGLDFSATNTRRSSGVLLSADSEVFDGYEEGTFLPQFQDLGTTEITTHICHYIRIGRICHLIGNFTMVDHKDNNNTMKIGGIPYLLRTGTNGGVAQTVEIGIGLEAGDDINGTKLTPSDSSIKFIKSNGSSKKYNDFSNNTVFNFRIAYEIN